MIKSTESYKKAVVATSRKMLVKASVDISDPDLVYGAVSATSDAPWSKLEELHDKDFTAPARYATLEPGRWVLDGSFKILPDNAKVPEHIGFCGNTLSGENGVFPSPQFLELMISDVSTLQACSVWFSTDPLDGIPVDFTVDVMFGGSPKYTKKYSGNMDTHVSMDGFTVFTPDAIRLTVTKWSLPWRRMRVVEIVPGIYEQWIGDQIKGLNIQQNGDFSCLTLPYGSCDLTIDNKDRRFEPRRKAGIFQSVEERQAVDVSIGARLESGAVEYKRVGVFYQFSDGWKTSDNGLFMNWELVDIVGLLANREFIPPNVLPTTLCGWIAAFVSQLGDNFKTRYHVDPAYANKPVTASKDAVTGKKTGELLRYACMAAGTWPRADANTGYLTAEPLWNQGNKITLDNIVNYPTIKANISIAALIFTLADGKQTQYVVSGNSTTSEQTVGIQNPFIHTPQDALMAARLILSCYGGNVMEIVGRGDPSSEIGDVDTVWLDESTATTGRCSMQSFDMSNGVLRGCQSKLIQADGSFIFENRKIFSADGVFHTGKKTTKVRLILQSGGQGGSSGGDGSFPSDFGDYDGTGKNGLDGAGGKVFSAVVNVNPDTDYKIQIGKGGKASIAADSPGEIGTDTTFGAFSSANGSVFPLGFSDVASGESYGRTGVEKPLDGTGDGGKGGKGGKAGAGYYDVFYDSAGNPAGTKWFVTSEPEKGLPGVDGADGVCVVYWDKEAE